MFLAIRNISCYYDHNFKTCDLLTLFEQADILTVSERGTLYLMKFV